MSKRKPFNDDAGYVASLRAPFGHVVIYDRKNGGDWIDGDERWIVASYDHDKGNIALIETGSLRRAREIMKDARDGSHDWMDEALADLAAA